MPEVGDVTDKDVLEDGMEGGFGNPKDTDSACELDCEDVEGEEEERIG